MWKRGEWYLSKCLAGLVVWGQVCVDGQREEQAAAAARGQSGE